MLLFVGLRKVSSQTVAASHGGVDLVAFNPFVWWRRDEEKGWDASIGYSGEKMFSSSKFREMLKTKQFVDYKGRVKAFARSLDLIR
jgi:hypothetical protein